MSEKAGNGELTSTVYSASPVPDWLPAAVYTKDTSSLTKRPFPSSSPARPIFPRWGS